MTKQDKIECIIPYILDQMNSDDQNQSEGLFNYYKECNQAEKTVINEIMMYLCGWTFETILENNGLKGEI
jgi:hypothetical protein